MVARSFLGPIGEAGIDAGGVFVGALVGADEICAVTIVPSSEDLRSLFLTAVLIV